MNQINSRNYLNSMDILTPLSKKVAIHIIGAGATGSFTTLALAKMGFEDITIYDFDVVELHNVDNQLYGPPHVGKAKVDALVLITRALSGINIKGIKATVNENTVFPEGCIVVIAVDSMKARKAIWESVKDLSLPYVVDSRMGAEELQVYTVNMVSQGERDWYASTLHASEEVLQVRCTEKSIMYTPFVLGGFLGNTVKKIVQNQPFEQFISFGFKKNQLTKHNLYQNEIEEVSFN